MHSNQNISLDENGIQKHVKVYVITHLKLRATYWVKNICFFESNIWYIYKYCSHCQHSQPFFIGVQFTN